MSEKPFDKFLRMSFDLEQGQVPNNEELRLMEFAFNYALDTRPTNDAKWISVEDELPPENNMGVHDSVYCLCMLNNGCGHKIVLWMNSRWTGFPSGSTKVTHWMPLPNIPKSEQEKMR